ncbi:MAG: NAD-dependent epimerase/dehydratase family protein [Dehalococcoidia bacterium]
MRVLVTGAAGFLGRHLVASLLADGHKVAGVDTFITSDREDLTRLQQEANFDFAELDVTSSGFGQFARGFRPDAIYHLACPTGVPNLGPMALEMLATSYEGSVAVLEVARERNASVLLTSSAEVYGNPEVTPQTEAYTGNVDTLGPRKGYEEGKRVAETLFAIYAERFGVQSRIVRVFNTYGPGMSLRETRVVPAFVRAALKGQPLTIHGNGGQTRCHTFASDMVQGLKMAMERGRPARAYNIGSQTPVTVKALAELVIRVADSPSTVEVIERPGHDHEHRLPDTARARTELGWSLSVSLEEGLRATIADFRERLGAGLVAGAQRL